MSNYDSCPISISGVHDISYNKYTGLAKCVHCGYKLLECETQFKRYDYKIRNNYTEFNKRNRRGYT